MPNWTRLLIAAAALSSIWAEERAPLGTYTPAERRHWSFQPRSNPEIPKLTKNPIDAFVLARLQKEGLAQAPKASRATLIRRAYFDMTGLPPSPEDVDAFVKELHQLK